MKAFLTKPVAGRLAHRIEFAPPTLGAGETLTGEVACAVQAPRGNAEELGVSETGVGATWIDIDLTRGAHGAIYMVTVEAATTAGRPIRHSFVVGIERRPCVPME